jgi:predicted nucleic acid-binding Zn ribbon protein
MIYEITLSIKDDIPGTIQCTLCKRDAYRVFHAPGIIFKGEGWSGQDIKRANEDDKMFTKARVARRLKASGAVPEDAVLRAEEVDPAKFHGDLSKKELDEKRCNYQGRTPPKKSSKD